ncbi:MAG: hypothetical protein QOH23_989, partial [Gaiellaceae bacterium]|nr:hypothetical protein [Gaiellaceae bacterium]
YLALIYPQTRHALRGIVRGDVELDWAWQHHQKWVKEVLASGQVGLEGEGDAKVPRT